MISMHSNKYTLEKNRRGNQELKIQRATLGTQDTRRRQSKQTKTQHSMRWDTIIDKQTQIT